MADSPKPAIAADRTNFAPNLAVRVASNYRSLATDLTILKNYLTMRRKDIRKLVL